MSDAAKSLFLDALRYVEEECYIDAISSFRKIVDESPSDELADDALFNAGLCYLRIGQVAKARETFGCILSEYPDATICATPDQREFGRTSAKARLALTEIALAEGNWDEAKALSTSLADYSDSYVESRQDGGRRSFHDLAEALLHR